MKIRIFLYLSGKWSLILKQDNYSMSAGEGYPSLKNTRRQNFELRFRLTHLESVFLLHNVPLVFWSDKVFGDRNFFAFFFKNFSNFSKNIRYFFLVVSRPLRKVFKKFSEKNSKKIKIFKFVKKFRTTFFFQRFLEKKSCIFNISQKLFDIFF